MGESSTTPPSPGSVMTTTFGGFVFVISTPGSSTITSSSLLFSTSGGISGGIDGPALPSSKGLSRKEVERTGVRADNKPNRPDMLSMKGLSS